MSKSLCFFLFLLSFLLLSCRPTVQEESLLRSTGDSITFSLDSKTTVLTRTLVPFTDKDGREFLTFQNELEPEILVYDMNTQEYIKTITIDKEGVNGVSLFLGYCIQSWDEIYLPNAMINEISVANSDGLIYRRLPYQESTSNKVVNPFTVMSHTPLTIIDQNIYFNQKPNRRLGERVVEDSPVSLVLDTITKQLTEFDLRFPPVLPSKKVLGSTLGIEFAYSRCYDGANFVYSFFFDEAISVVSPTGHLERKVKAKSRYLEHIYSGNKMPADLGELNKMLCEIPFYGHLIYDKYRNVYYRFVYPETEMLPTDDFTDVWLLGRSKFSIIILNKDLEVIGETLFPENIYASKLCFVREDGLYLGTSFVNNPNFSDDKLSFKRIEFNVV